MAHELREQALIAWCRDAGYVLDSADTDEPSPHIEAFRAGFDAAAPDGPTLRQLRYLLNELHYVADGGGVIEDDLARELEAVMRWLLSEYLRRGTHTTNDPNVTE